MGALSIGVADISAFVDIPTPPAVKKSPLALIGQLELTGCQVLTECWFAWYGPCATCFHDAKKGGENYENRNIIFGSLAFHRHTGRA